jgi:hypothetical protein
MKDKKSKRIILNFALSFCILIFAFCIFARAQAAQFNLTPQTQEISIGQQFQVDLALDTEGENINAVEGKIVFPTDLLELKEIRDGNSIINFWVERPVVPSIDANINTNKNEIKFSGITPGGFIGDKNFLFSAIFLAKKTGSGVIGVTNSRTLLNDGKGTAAETKAPDMHFSISEIAPEIQTPKIEDNDQPEIFQPEVNKDESVFGGKWFLVFATQDKGSGIDHYEVSENRKQEIENIRWITAESPYLLSDQKLESYIYVKAIDKAGNERIAIVLPKYPLGWYEIWWVWGIIIIGVVLGYVVWKILKSKIKK